VLVELLHAERDALGLGVDADDLHLHGLTYRKHVGWMIDAFPGDVGNMKKAVDASEIDECTVIGDVLDDTVDHLAFGEILNELRALLGSGLLHDGAPRYDDIAAASIHLEDLKGLTDIHEGADIADRANVDLAAGQEGYRTAQIDGEAAFDSAEDHPIDTLVTGIRLLKPPPCFLASRLIAGEHRFAERILDTLEIYFDFVAGLDRHILAGLGEFFEGHAAFGLEADIDDDVVIL